MRTLFHLVLSLCVGAVLACDDPDPANHEGDATADAAAGGAQDGSASAPGAQDAGASGSSDAASGSGQDAASVRVDASSGAQPDAAGSGGATCAQTKCPTDQYCDDLGGTPECLPAPSCKTVKCTAGTVCQLVEVQCIRAPCPPQPMCVPSGGAEGDAGVRCGKATCAVGERCCSPTCGICGSAKGVCPTITCPPEP